MASILALGSIALLKLVLIAAVLLLGRHYVASEYIVFRRAIAGLMRDGKTTKIAIYHAILLTLFLSIVASPFIADAAVRLALVGYFSTSTAALLIYRNLNGAHVDHRAFFDDDVIELLWRERNMAGDAIRTYYRQLLPIALPFLFVLGALAWSPGAAFRIDYPYELLPLAALIGFAAAFPRGALKDFPTFVTIPLKAIRHVRHGDLPSHTPLRDVELPVGAAAFDKIIIIMDESIRADYLGIGDPGMTTTPYLKSVADRMVNYGVAVSGHNCSSYSRYLLRHGARAEDLPAAVHNGLSLPGPNIWQYAKAAGFRTVYIDGFSNSLRLHSGMTLEEASWIEEYRRIPQAAPHDRDTLVGESLLEALRDPAPAMIYIDKFGLHNPYEDKFPREGARYGSDPGAGARDRMIAAYKNGICWSVDDFFRAIVPAIDFSRTALIYTSDHGQSMMDAGYALCHCSTGEDIAAGEAFVPLFVMSGDLPTRRALEEALPRFRDRATQFDIFATVLAFLGYDWPAVVASYGTGLFGEPSGLSSFLAGFKTSTRWVEADRSEFRLKALADDRVASECPDTIEL